MFYGGATLTSFRSIFGHRPGSFTRRQAGDSPHAGAAVLAVVLSGNEPRHRRLSVGFGFDINCGVQLCDFCASERAITE